MTYRPHSTYPWHISLLARCSPVRAPCPHTASKCIADVQRCYVRRAAFATLAPSRVHCCALSALRRVQSFHSSGWTTYSSYPNRLGSRAMLGSAIRPVHQRFARHRAERIREASNQGIRCSTTFDKLPIGVRRRMCLCFLCHHLVTGGASSSSRHTRRVQAKSKTAHGVWT